MPRTPLAAACACALALLGIPAAPAQEESPIGLDRWWRGTLDYYGRTQEVVQEDLDGDGRIDLAVIHVSTVEGKPRRYVSVFFQSPDGFRSMPDQTFTAMPSAGALVFADIHPAPGMEIVSLTGQGVWYQALRNRAYSLEPGLLLYERTFFDRPQADGLPVWKGAADVDVNGKTDLVLPLRDGFRVYYQDSDGTFPKILTLSAAPERSVESREGAFLQLTHSLPAVHVQDFDGDHRNDLLVTSKDHFEVYLQDIKGNLPAVPSITFDLTFFSERLARDQVQSVVARLMDVNGDHSVDMVVAYTHGDIGVFESIVTQVLVFLGRKGQPYSNTPDQIINLSGVSIDPRVVDINKDGALDLVVSSLRTDLFAGLKGAALRSVSVTYYIYLFQPKEGRFSGSPDYSRDVSIPTKALEQGGTEIPRIYFDGDFDGDGMLDMVTVSGQGRLGIYPGRKSFGIMHSGGFAYKKDELLLVNLKDAPRGIDVRDLNGDGRSDFVLRHTSRLEVFLSR